MKKYELMVGEFADKHKNKMLPAVVVLVVLVLVTFAFRDDDASVIVEHDPAVSHQADLSDKYSHHVMHVVKHNDCYSYGSNTGWVKSVCHSTYDEAMADKLDFEAFLAKERAHAETPWKGVSE